VLEYRASLAPRATYADDVDDGQRVATCPYESAIGTVAERVHIWKKLPKDDFKLDALDPVNFLTIDGSTADVLCNWDSVMLSVVATNVSDDSVADTTYISPCTGLPLFKLLLRVRPSISPPNTTLREFSCVMCVIPICPLEIVPASVLFAPGLRLAARVYHGADVTVVHEVPNGPIAV
jgi:hypothetical protein